MLDTFDIFSLIKRGKKEKAHKQKFSPTDLPKSFLSTLFQYTNYLLHSALTKPPLSLFNKEAANKPPNKPAL